MAGDLPGVTQTASMAIYDAAIAGREHDANALVLVLAGGAIQYLLLASEFLAITQVLVYIGAIVVLFLFGIMLTRAELGKSDDLDNDMVQKIVGLLVAGLIGVTLLGVLANQYGQDKLELAGQTTTGLGQTTPQGMVDAIRRHF